MGEEFPGRTEKAVDASRGSSCPNLPRARGRFAAAGLGDEVSAQQGSAPDEPKKKSAHT